MKYICICTSSNQIRGNQQLDLVLKFIKEQNDAIIMADFDATEEDFVGDVNNGMDCGDEYVTNYEKHKKEIAYTQWKLIQEWMCLG